MSNTLKLVAMLGLVVAVSACARQTEEFVVVNPEPISVEPVHHGKIK